MPTALVTGSYGLVGSCISTCLHDKSWSVIGVDCDARSTLFSDVNALTIDDISQIYEERSINTFSIDLSNFEATYALLESILSSTIIDLVVHCAAQPSHDWAASNPLRDKQLNIDATLNICECLRLLTPNSLLIHLSTNKVYGDLPNKLPLKEYDSRFDLPSDHRFFNGIDETLSIDNSLHSLFGVSKASADLYVQEYSRYFGIPAVILRGGCLTGPRHRGAKLHGFMNYLIKCCLTSKNYIVNGYKGKQVRDNLHARDISYLVELIFLKHHTSPPSYPVTANIGGGRSNSCSIIELIGLLTTDFGLQLKYEISDINRIGDHIWYITDNSKLLKIYDWKPNYSLNSIISETISFLSA